MRNDYKRKYSFGRRFKLLSYKGINEILLRKSYRYSEDASVFVYGILELASMRSKRESFRLFTIENDGLIFNGSKYSMGRYYIDHAGNYYDCSLIIDGIDFV